MKGKKLNKKAMFFTMGAFLLILSLIAMMSIANKKADLEKDIAIDRTYELSNSIEQAIIELFLDTSLLNVSITPNPDETTDVTFVEYVRPKQQGYATPFFTLLQKLEDFVEAEEHTFDIDIVDLSGQDLPMIIKPHGVGYTRDKSGTGRLLSVEVTPSDEGVNFGSYDVKINAKDVGIKSFTPKNLGEPGETLVNVTAVDNSGYYANWFSEIDIFSDSWVEIQLAGGNKIDVRTSYVIEGVLTVYSNDPLDQGIIVETKIDRLEKRDEPVRILVYESMIDVSLPALDIYRLDDVMIELGGDYD